MSAIRVTTVVMRPTTNRMAGRMSHRRIPMSLGSTAMEIETGSSATVTWFVMATSPMSTWPTVAGGGAVANMLNRFAI